MTTNIRKYLPWGLTLLLAALAVWLGTRGVDTPPATTVEVVRIDTTVKSDTVRTVQVKTRVVFVTVDTMSAEDSLRLIAAQAAKDSIENVMLQYGASIATLDTTSHLHAGDSLSVDVRTIVTYSIERRAYEMAQYIIDQAVQYTCNCPAGASTWQWIERAAFTAAAIILKLIK